MIFLFPMIQQNTKPGRHGTRRPPKIEGGKIIMRIQLTQYHQSLNTLYS